RYRAASADSTLSLHDALPTSDAPGKRERAREEPPPFYPPAQHLAYSIHARPAMKKAPSLLLQSLINKDILDDRSLQIARILEQRSEEHTSELQSRENLVCRLL